MRFFLRQDEAADRALLARWEQVLEGSEDPRLDIAKALIDRDAAAFDDALQRYLATVEAHNALCQKELHPTNRLPLEGQLSVEALALVVLAEQVGLATRPDYLFIPSLARARARLLLPSDTWTRVTE